jgi:hypothetical protein
VPKGIGHWRIGGRRLGAGGLGFAGALLGGDVVAEVVAARALGGVAIALAGPVAERSGVVPDVVSVRTAALEPPQAGDSTSSASATVVARADLTAPILRAGGGRAGQWRALRALDICTNLASALRARGIGGVQVKTAGRQRASTPMHATAATEPQTAPAFTTTRRSHAG